MKPLTPPLELVKQWATTSPVSYCNNAVGADSWDYESVIAARAAQWGADQELEAVKVIAKEKGVGWFAVELQQERRPKPPSLKARALEAARLELNPEGRNGSLIIQALETLPEA